MSIILHASRLWLSPLKASQMMPCAYSAVLLLFRFSPFRWLLWQLPYLEEKVYLCPCNRCVVR